MALGMALPGSSRLTFTADLEICRLLVGMWQVSGAHGRIDRERALRAMLEHFDAGFTTFDLADHYGPAEDFVGEFRRRLRAERGEETLARLHTFTKWVPEPGPMTRPIVEGAIDVSLRRMDVPALDLLQFRWWDYGDMRYLDALRRLADLREAGKIRHLALTNFDTEHLETIDLSPELALRRRIGRGPWLGVGVRTIVERRPRTGWVAVAAGGLLVAVLAAGCEGGGGERPVPRVEANVASMDAVGDSISKGFNSVSEGEACPDSDLERRNWSTGVTHGGDLCGDGGEGVFSHAERLECLQGKQIVRAEPNAALSGARMLTEFAGLSRGAAGFLASQPEPRYVTVLLGHNDVCAGTIERVRASCPNGGDEDPQNHCRTTSEAFERELRKGLDALIGVPSLRIGVAALVRVSLLCIHAGKDSCRPGLGSCQQLWANAVALGVPDERGICGSLTVDCSDARVASAYETAQAYRDVLARVAGEYAAVPAGGASPVARVGGETVGGATEAPGVEVVFSDAPWRARFDAADLSCCDCFHPSVAGQDRLARILLEGLACGDRDPCCADAGDPVLDGRCAREDRSGTFHAGFFPRAGP